MRTFLYSLETALKNLWIEKWINILTTLTIAVGLLILGTFFLITVNLDSSLSRWSKGFGIIVYLDDNMNREGENLLREYFQKDPDIVEVRYVSKSAALKDVKKVLGDESTILDGFRENPLLASFELKLRQEALEPEHIRVKASRIKQLHGVDDVQYGEKWLASLNAMTKGMKVIVLIIGTIILTAIAFSTYSTMKILFYRRADEIETLKLLGATRKFIRLPFILEGFFMGIAGGLAGLSGLVAIYHFSSSKVFEFMPAMKGLLTFLPPEAYLAAPLAGIVMSIIGSLLAVGRIRY